MVSWAVSCLNVRGLGGQQANLASSINRAVTFKWLKGSCKSDVYLLSETNIPHNKIGQWSKEWGGPCLWCPGGTHGGGTAILIHPKSDLVFIEGSQFKPGGLLSGRVVMVCVEVNGEKFSIISAYAPSQPKHRGRFIKLLDKEAHRYNIEHEVSGLVTGGDWNTIPNPLLDKSHNKTNQGLPGSKAMADLVRSHALVDMWRERNPVEPGYTRFSERLNSRLDRMYCDHSTSHTVTRVRHVTCPMSDHKAVHIRMHTRQVPKKLKSGCTVMHSLMIKCIWMCYSRI